MLNEMHSGRSGSYDFKITDIHTRALFENRSNS